MNSTIGGNIIKITNYTATFAPRTIIETPVIPSYNDLQSQNTVISSTGYGRHKYSISCYTTDGTVFTAILGLYMNFSSTVVNIYVQDDLKVTGNHRITNMSYSVDIGDTPKGQTKYNMTIEVILA